jgi:hypothetical protein
LETGVLTLDFAENGTVWAITENGAIGTFDMQGKFYEHVPAIANLLETGRYKVNIKAVGELVVAAHQEYGVWIYRKNAFGKLELLKHISKGNEFVFGTPVISVCDNQMLLLVSYMGMVPIDVHYPDKIKKLKKFQPTQTLDSGRGGCSIIDCGNNEILAYSEENTQFQLYLLEVSEVGIKLKNKIKGKHFQFDRSIEGMFLKDNYLIMVGTLDRASGSSFEVYEYNR